MKTLQIHILVMCLFWQTINLQARETQSLDPILKRINNAALIGLGAKDFRSLIDSLKPMRQDLKSEDQTKFDQLLGSLDKIYAAVEGFEDCGSYGVLKEIALSSAQKKMSDCLNASTDNQLHNFSLIASQLDLILSQLQSTDKPPVDMEKLARLIHQKQRESLVPSAYILEKKYLNPLLPNLDEYAKKLTTGQKTKVEDGDWLKNFLEVSKKVRFDKDGLKSLNIELATRLKNYQNLSAQVSNLQDIKSKFDREKKVLGLKNIFQLDADLIVQKEKNQDDMEKLKYRSQVPRLNALGILTPATLDLKPAFKTEKDYDWDRKKIKSVQEPILKNTLARYFVSNPQEYHRRIAAKDYYLQIKGDGDRVLYEIDLRELMLDQDKTERSYIENVFADQKMRRLASYTTTSEGQVQALRDYELGLNQGIGKILKSSGNEVHARDLDKIHTSHYTKKVEPVMDELEKDINHTRVDKFAAKDLSYQAMFEGDSGKIVMGSLSKESDLGVFRLLPKDLEDNPKIVKEYLQEHLASVKSLIKEFDEAYQKSPDEFIKKSLQENPMLTLMVAQEHPEYLSALCHQAKDIIIDEASARKWRMAAVIAMTIAAVALTATAIGAPAGSMLAAVAAGGGIALGVTGATMGFHEYAKLSHESDHLIDRFRALGEESGLDPITAAREAQDLAKQAKSAFRWAVLDVALAPIDILQATKALKELKTVDELKAVLASPEKFKKFVLDRQLNIAPRLDDQAIEGFLTYVNKDQALVNKLGQYRLDQGEEKYIQILESISRLSPDDKVKAISLLKNYNLKEVAKIDFGLSELIIGRPNGKVVDIEYLELFKVAEKKHHELMGKIINNFENKGMSRGAIRERVKKALLNCD